MTRIPRTYAGRLVKKRISYEKYTRSGINRSPHLYRPVTGAVVELGAGAGSMRDFVPDIQAFIALILGLVIVHSLCLRRFALRTDSYAVGFLTAIVVVFTIT